MSADLEYALSEPLPARRGMSRHPGRLRMEDSRAEPDQSCGDQHHLVADREGKAEEAQQRRAHAGDHRVGPRPAVGEIAQYGLQNR